MGVRLYFIPIALTLGCSDYQVVKQTFTESFHQPERKEGIDILWVVDDSATMYEEHDLLMNSADAFIGFVANTTIDYRLAIVNTDFEEDYGRLQGAVLTPESTGMVDSFISQVDMDRAGSRNERGFDAAIVGADPSVEQGFARAKADLELVIFSDEDDHSSVDAATFLDTLKSQRSGSAKVKVHAVVGDPPVGCVSALAAADVGSRYLEAQAITEGRRESICTLDYGAMLARVALDVIGLETSFVLEKVPEVPTIELLVDGLKIHQRDRDGWKYNPGDNSIQFDGFAVPQPGSVVDVTYSEWYGPTYEREEDTGQ